MSPDLDDKIKVKLISYLKWCLFSKFDHFLSAALCASSRIADKRILQIFSYFFR